MHLCEGQHELLPGCCGHGNEPFGHRNLEGGYWLDEEPYVSQD